MCNSIDLSLNMSDLHSILALGRELGYEGSELLNFAETERAYQEKVEAQVRQDRYEQREHEKEQREFELQRQERESRNLAKQLEILQLQQSQPIQNSEGGEEREGLSAVKVKGPTLPHFDSNKDDLDAYLRRFERFAIAAGWDRQTWAVILSSHLQGVALDVYSRLSQQEAEQYDVVKAALLDRFEYTEEGFRIRFRTSRPQRGERVSQFVTRLRNLLERWIELAGCEGSVQGIKDFFIKEQLMNCCNKGLMTYLREKYPLSLEAMIGFAEPYVEAHGGFQANSSLNKHGGEKQEVSEILQTQSSNKTPEKQKVIRPFPVKCHYCGQVGHKFANCKRRRNYEVNACLSGNEAKDEKRTGSAEVLDCGHVTDVVSALIDMPIEYGRLCGCDVKVLRDTGCSTVVARKSLVPAECFTGQERMVKLANGQLQKYPVAEIEVESPYFNGKTTAVCMPNPSYDLMIGNIPGSTSLCQDRKCTCFQACAVTTRAGAQRTPDQPVKPLRCLDLKKGLQLTTAELRREQLCDPSLKKWREYALHGHPVGRTQNCRFQNKRGLLYRMWDCQGERITQLVLPKSVRTAVMEVAHEGLLGGHFGVGKTTNKIKEQFAWPGMQVEIRRFCQSCDRCQRVFPKGKVGKVPLGEVPLIDTPFKRVAVDIVGPIEPRTKQGNRYILTCVDYATRYPEAIPLPAIDTQRVAEALLDIFSRVGVPEELVSDRGTQFTSQMMSEVRRLLSIKHLPTTPYHAMGNGLVERYNGVLKTMLRKMCAEQPKEWDRYLPALLFAYRETPQSSMGFSPFELLYGRTVRGPLTILRELWDKDEGDQLEVMSTYEYIFKLREKLEDTCRIAQQHLKQSQARYKTAYDRKARDRQFKVKDKVLLLLPTSHNKLLLQWQGPYEVVEKRNRMDYVIDQDGKRKVYHANLLRRYIDRGEDIEQVSVAVVEEDNQDEGLPRMELPNLHQQEGVRDVQVNPALTHDQQVDVQRILLKYQDILTDVPGKTSLIEHDIKLVQEEIVKSKGYPIPHALRPKVKEELELMKRLEIIRPSKSPYSTPMVIVRKTDGSQRICLDFRKLNALTVFDGEPMPDPDYIFGSISGSQYFSKIDLTKGYWQIPLGENSKQYTAFPTEEGLYEFNVLPFGLVCAPASFNRLMREVLDGLSGVKFFLDDILVHSNDWESHVVILEAVFQRLRDAGLTAKPSKCNIGMTKIDYLGHVVGQGCMWPMHDKVSKINNAPRPVTKKQLRSFLGLSGYYRKFIPHYSTLASPLSDLTRKGNPNVLQWNDEHERAFNELKTHIANPPVLLLPNVKNPFILRTDASNTGLGAVLLQDIDGGKRPVAFASRKLIPREQKFSTIEKEALAIVWAVKHFQVYLYGQYFVLETDHKPLHYMNSARDLNSRIARWSLALQPYTFRIDYIKGSENVGADYMSRVNVNNGS